MPENDRHRQQRQKNIFLLIVLVSLVAVIYGLAMVRFPH